MTNLKSSPFSADWLAEQRRRISTTIFAAGVLKAREATGRSVQEAAGRAGMKPAEWAAIEQGYGVPQNTATLEAMAAALEIDFTEMANFVLRCWPAWED